VVGSKETGTSRQASVIDTKVWQFAVWPSAEAYCAATPTARALLRHRGIINHLHNIAATDEPVRLSQQLSLQLRRIPNASRHKMMQLIISPGASRSAIG
jgi:hypothetical protein